MPDQDEPRWGPASTYRARPAVRRRPAAAGRGVGAPVAEPARAAPGRDDRYHGQHDVDDHPDDGHGGDYGRTDARPRRSRPRRRGRTVAVVLVLLLAVVVAYPVLLARTAMAEVGRVDALSGSTAADTPGRTILVVGSDSREGTAEEELDSSRTDTILVLHRPTDGPTVLLSLPRDSLVEIPGAGENKINASYTIGGPALLVQTVEQATGLKVDSYVETGLGGFGQVVDAVGGVTICPTRAMQDEMSGLDVQPGCQPADGRVALAYARSRFEDPRGDLGRVERQREVMAAIADKGFSPGTVLNPFNAFPLAQAGGKALTMDEQDGITDLGWFLLSMRDSAGGAGLSLTVPVQDTTRRTRHGVVVDWDRAKAEQVFQALRDSSTEAIRPIAEEQARTAAGG